MEYLSKIKMKVSLAKKRAILEFQERKDHEMILTVTNKKMIHDKECNSEQSKQIRETFGGQNMRSN
jgi:hypothetical protein